MKTVTDSVILVTFGRQSNCRFILRSDFRAWLQTLPANERKCVLVTETDMSPADLEFMDRSQKIIDRLEMEQEEVEQTVVDYFTARKKTANF